MNKYKLRGQGEIYDDIEMTFVDWKDLREEIIDQCKVLEEIVLQDNERRLLATKNGNLFYKNLLSTIVPTEECESLLIDIDPYYSFTITRLEN